MVSLQPETPPGSFPLSPRLPMEDRIPDSLVPLADFVRCGWLGMCPEDWPHPVRKLSWAEMCPPDLYVGVLTAECDYLWREVLLLFFFFQLH